MLGANLRIGAARGVLEDGPKALSVLGAVLAMADEGAVGTGEFLIRARLFTSGEALERASAAETRRSAPKVLVSAARNRSRLGHRDEALVHSTSSRAREYLSPIAMTPATWWSASGLNMMYGSFCFSVRARAAARFMLAGKASAAHSLVAYPGKRRTSQTAVQTLRAVPLSPAQRERSNEMIKSGDFISVRAQCL
jgi:hypothetical protein